MNLLKNTSLHKNISILFSLCIIGSTLFMGAGAAIKGTKEINIKNNTQVNLSFNASSEVLSTYMKSCESYINNLASDPLLVDYINELDSFGSRINGVTTGLTDENIKIVEFQKKLNSLHKANLDTGMLYVYLATDKGQFIQGPEEDMGDDYQATTRDWYKNAVKSDGITWSDVYTDYTSGQTCITAALPIKTEDGRVLGVLAADVVFNFVADKIANFNTEGDNFFGIITLDENKRPQFEYINDSNISQALIGKEITNDKSSAQSIENVYSPELESSIKSQEEHNNTTFMNTKLNGTKYRLAINKDKNNNWYNVIGINYFDYIKPTISLAFTVILVGISIMILFIIGVSKVLKNISNSITHITDVVSTLETGDLSSRCSNLIIKRTDEIGTLAKGINSLGDTQLNLMKEIQDVSDILAASAQNLTASSEENTANLEEIEKNMLNISDTTYEQVISTENSVRLASQLSEKLNELYESSKDMVICANLVKENNNCGLENVSSLLQFNQESNNATEQISNNISELSLKTQNIQSIVDTIMKISEQINLLSLNASIESARAGEHGKGFSVVADEVKKLATLSSNAATQIEDIIYDIKKDVGNAVEIIKNVKSIVEKQTESVNEVSNSFKSISESSSSISSYVDKVGNSVEKINDDKNHILVSLENILTTTQNNAAATEEVSATTQQQATATEESSKTSFELSGLSLRLAEKLRHFKI